MNSAASSPPKLLVLGGPSSGKSTYRAQLYQRIEHNPGDLTLVKSVGDSTAIEDDVERLAQGLQPRHTSVNTYRTTAFSVAARSGRQFTLEFADYDGEQVARMASSHDMPHAWIERARHSEGWLYFLRIDSLRAAKSFMTDPVAAGPREDARVEVTPAAPSSEIGAVETLQRLLFVRGASSDQPLESPCLAVLLSCWDELPATERNLSPAALLDSRAPLLNKYLHTTWRSDQLRIWGLSSTEQSLPEAGGDQEFARRGPHHFGYVVTGEGAIVRDLTIPVSWLFQRQ